MRCFALILCALCLPMLALHAQGNGVDDTTDTFTPDWDWTPEQFMANEMAYSLGGQKLWRDKTWNISFDVVLSSENIEAARYHYDLNRAKNQCTIIGKTPDNRMWKVFFTDLATRQGTATVEDKPVIESELPMILDMAYTRFKTDYHALFLPFELLDSGVALSIAPDTLINGATYAIMEVTFPEDSLVAPANKFWISVGAQSKMVDGYRCYLPNGSQMFYKVDMYRQFGRLRLATRRTSLDGRTVMKFENIHIDKATVQ